MPSCFPNYEHFSVMIFRGPTAVILTLKDERLFRKSSAILNNHSESRLWQINVLAHFHFIQVRDALYIGFIGPNKKF
jgi:hypothetical protein